MRASVLFDRICAVLNYDPQYIRDQRRRSAGTGQVMAVYATLGRLVEPKLSLNELAQGAGVKDHTTIMAARKRQWPLSRWTPDQLLHKILRMGSDGPGAADQPSIETAEAPTNHYQAVEQLIGPTMSAAIQELHDTGLWGLTREETFRNVLGAGLRAARRDARQSVAVTR